MSSSEFDPEAPTPKSDPNFGQHPLKSQYPSASQPTYQAKTPDINKINADWNQVANAIDNIAVINGQIRDVLLSTTDALKSLKDELGTADSVRSQKKLPPPAMHKVGVSGYVDVPDRDIEPTAGFLQGRAASQQELETQRNEDIQRQLTRMRVQKGDEYQQRISSYQSMQGTEQFRALRQIGIVNDQGGRSGAMIGGRFRTADEISGAFSNDPKSREPEQQTLVDILNQEFRERVTDELEKKAPSRIEGILDAIEFAGIRQLRYGQLTMQDILKSAGTISGNALLSINQAQQQRAAWELARDQAIQAGETPPEEPIYTGAGRSYMNGSLIGRAMGSRVGTGVLGFGARWAPVAGQALAIGQIAQQTVSNLYGRTVGRYLDTKRSGQLTGEGFGAGLAADWQGFSLGLNPFDSISMADARKIVASTRERGFTGREGTDVQEGIRSVVNDLGISIDQAADYFTDAMRKGGMSVDQVRKQLSVFDDSAHDLNMNINDYTAAILQQTQSLRGIGFGGAAPDISQSIMRALPIGYRNDPQAQSFFSNLIQQNRGALTARLNAQGVPANYLTVTSARYAGQTTRATDDLIKLDINQAIIGLRAQGNNNPDANDIANWMSQAGVYTKGSDPGFLTQYVRRLRRGLGIGNQIQTQQALRTYRGIVNQESRRRVAVGDMNKDELARLGIHESTRMLARGVATPQWTDRQGNLLDPTQKFRVVTGESNLTGEQLVRARRAAINALPQGYLTKGERKTLMSHLDDARFQFKGHDVDFAEALRRIGSERRQVDSNTIKMNGITIELKGKAARDLFKLNVERKNAVGNGSLPANQNPTRINGQ